MKNLRTYNHFILSLLTLLAVVGCVKDDMTSSVDYRSREYIGFTAALTADTRSAQGSTMTSSYLTVDEQEWPLYAESDTEQTRGSVVSALNGLQVGMYALPYTDVDTNKQFKDAVMTNKQFLFINNEELEADGDYVLWSSIKDADYLRVYGYAPYNSAYNSATSTDGQTTISYTVDSDITKQQDIIATEIKDVPKDYCQNIPLTFEHILTGVRFKAGFDCMVTSLKITGVKNSGDYTIGEVWKNQSGTAEFSLPIDNNGRNIAEGEYISTDTEILMMIPQTLDGAKVVMEYEVNGTQGTITASLDGLRWDKGALVTYTLHESNQQIKTFYFDLAAGNVEIGANYISGSYYYKDNGITKSRAIRFDAPSNYTTGNIHVYICQSTEANYAQSGYEHIDDWKDPNKIYRIPVYDDVKVGNQSWSDFITNNSNVESVIEAWDTKQNIDADASKSAAPNTGAAVRQAGRTSTPYFIKVNGVAYDKTNSKINVEITLDNIYSRYQESSYIRTTGGLTFTPTVDYSTLTVNLVGDNRVGCVHYYAGNSQYNNNKLIFQGSGSLTAASVDFKKATSAQSSEASYKGDNIEGYNSNYFCSAIGGSDEFNKGHAIGIKIKSGIIFAGTTQAENCTAIGGGGNDKGVITIEGGSVTAVATTTGTAIGGGLGFNSAGGTGNVIITGGIVYAYNHANEWEIPSAAIGSAGSWHEPGGKGTVTISGGYVYAQTALGTAIGGGSSKTKQGGSATINISGNSYVIAKSIAAYDNYSKVWYPAGNGIGGGTGGTGKASDDEIPSYGGSATVEISGNPTIRTGSIGGGKTNNPEGKLGSATINISGGDISAQFVMAGGAGKESSFTMTDGTISNSDVHSNEFYHTQNFGGAVYMEDGIFNMSGNAKIRNCNADKGGAVYISKSANALDSPKFYMKGGTIEYCQSASSGGAVYLKGGEVFMSGGTISQNMAQNGNGGGMYIAQGNLAMSGSANVSENSAVKSVASSSLRDSATAGNGGGIYVTSPNGNVNVDIIGGTITGNSCNQNGGGICVDMSQAKETDVATINIGSDGQTGGPQIDGNKAVFYGGGLYAKGTKAEVTIYDGSIKDNVVTNYVPNEDVANEGGTVKLIDGDVSHKVVYFNKNTSDSADINPGSTKIVTATNSYLNLPNATRNNYILEEWNTRSDGKGISYKTSDNPILMNITENVTLYAQWKSQATGQ